MVELVPSYVKIIELPFVGDWFLFQVVKGLTRKVLFQGNAFDSKSKMRYYLGLLGASSAFY